jgi:signal transduction histidine kinase/DNA-binding response OmpR family regulator
MSGETPEEQVRVLAVDDDENNLRAIAALLAEVPAQLVLARSGEEALRCLLRDDYAVILLDIRMPGLDGFETAALIRERARSRRTPIIFLTAHARSDGEMLRGYRLGAVDFLTKPVLPEEVLRDKVTWFVTAQRAALLLERERARTKAAELRAHQRQVEEAKRRGEAEALRSEMERQRALSQRLELARQRLSVLSSIASELVLSPRPLEVLPRQLHALSSHLGLEVHLLHVAGERGALALRYHAGVPEPLLEALERVPRAEQPCFAAAERRMPLVVEDMERAGEGFGALRLLGLAAAACHPLVAEDRLVGVLSFGTRSRRALDRDELDVLAATADQVAMALERARLIEELRLRADDLARADRRKDEFLAMLAHELRNPLAPILSGVEILGQEGASEAARARALDAAGRQVRHLARLVDDLVDVSRIRSGKIELRRERVDLARVVQDAVTAVERLLREQGQELVVELPDERVVLDCDPVRLTQAVENLLHNSAKYTDPHGHVRLAARRSGAEVVLRVEDDGIGIPPELLPRVFDVFVQAKQPPSRARGGLGLGLALVRSLVELHGGTVRAESSGPGKGSAFEVRLPALASAEATPPAEPRARSNGHRAQLRIAIIEDNPDIRETLRELLELGGHEVVEAEDGVRGIELVLARQPHVAFVDIGLPGLDGYEVASRVRDRGTRLVALTGYGGAEHQNRAAGAGFDAHLVKPVDLAALYRVLDGFAPEGVAHQGELTCPSPPPA